MEVPPPSNNVEEELRRVHLALDTVYSPSTSQAGGSVQWWQQRSLADKYLVNFQWTTVAWVVCDRILQEDGSVPSPVQQQRRFFAAQTLLTKIRTNLQELPQSSLPSLKESLLTQLGRYCREADTTLTNRLAMCVSALAVQMSWLTVTTDLLQSVAQEPQNRKQVMILLSVLPEECASERLVLYDESLRYQMRDHLVSSALQVFEFLHSSTQNESPERILEALHTWIRYVPIHPDIIANSPLLQASIQALTQPRYLERATDVLVEILRMYPSYHPANEGLVKTMIPLLSQLPLDEALRSDDEDILRSYCRIVTEMGESYLSLIVSIKYDQASQLVDWVVKCSSIPIIDIASITLHFWYRMVMDLEGIEPYEFRQDLVDNYTPHLCKLVDLCASSLMRYPSDITDLPEDYFEDLNRHRFYVAEALKDLCRLLGGHAILERISMIIRQEYGRVSGRLQSEWQGIESCLAALACMSQFVPNDEADILPFVFSLVDKLPPDITPLRSTVCLIIGKYASWLAAHPNLLQPLLPYLAQSLPISESSSAAAVSIKELCECSNQNVSLGESVLALYESVSNTGKLALKDELQILEGVCRALSKQMHDTGKDGSPLLSRLAQPIGSRLAAQVADSTCSAKQLIPDIDRLTTIVQYLSFPVQPVGTHPIVELITSSWPILDSATTRFPKDFIIAEKVCRLHKHSLRKCGPRVYAPMLDALVSQLDRSFELSHQSPYLYAASICVTEYGRDPAYTQRLYNMVAKMSTTTFSFLRNLQEFTQHPDVVEELFYLMGRMISYCPDPLVTSPLLHALFQCAAVGLELDHRDANKGTLNFLGAVVSYGLSLPAKNNPQCQAALEQVVSQDGHAIAKNLARALMGDLPIYSQDFSLILWKLNRLCQPLMSQWMAEAFSQSAIPDQAKNEFMAALDSRLPQNDFAAAMNAFQSTVARERRLGRRP